jgi:hypothetical protein
MIQTGKDLAAAAEAVAKDRKTLYVMGCFGAPLTSANKKRYTTNHSYNQQSTRSSKINAASTDTFGFDCVGLIKGLLWGWNGAKGKTYGGATYQANNTPDLNADTMFSRCNSPSADFAGIQPGEAVWTDGHIGVYIGDGLAVESTPNWADGVQITAVLNIGKVEGYKGRRWKKHGQLPFVTYGEDKTVEQLAREVIAGKWGDGPARKRRLKAAGYDPSAVQKQVNILLK